MITQEEALKEVQELKKRFDAKQAYLFGSVARNEHHEQSDIDVILIKETNKRFHHRIGDVLDVLPVHSRIEPLVYTPEEFARLEQTPAIQHMLRGSIEV